MTVYLKEGEIIENVTKVVHIPSNVLGFSWLEIHYDEGTKVISFEFLDYIENI